jgi:hypothetical protein
MNPRPKIRAAALMAAVMATPGMLAAGPVPVWAGTPPVASVAAASDQAAADREYVLFLLQYDPRSLVRIAAGNALTVRPNKVDAAVARFFKSELQFAADYSLQRDASNADFARRILATHTPEFAPEVHAAAERALAKGPAALETFATTGYEQARRRDRAARDTAGEQAEALRDDDRRFVARLRDTDPGEHVRAAAGYALSTAADADVVEFFAYDWAAAAAVDRKSQLQQCTDADMVGRASLKLLEPSARKAEQTALTAADEAKALQRALAARAWNDVRATADPMVSTWSEAQRTASLQAAHWQQIAMDAAAASADNPNWRAIAGTAQTTAQQWLTTRDNAAVQAAYWTARYQEALAGEQRMQP